MTTAAVTTAARPPRRHAATTTAVNPAAIPSRAVTPTRAPATKTRATGASRTAARSTRSPTTAATASPGRRRVRRAGVRRACGRWVRLRPPAGAPGAGYGAGYGQGDYPAGGANVTLQLDDGSGRTYQLREGANVIGRGQDAQFRLPDTGVSRRHLEIRWDGQVALLADLNSTNGTTVNNAPVQEWQLADGDVIRLGHSEIIVRVH